METPERVLRRLQFKVVRRLDGYFFGDYTGVFYGPSLDLAEVREYQPGDEIRRIDWNVTARMNRLFVRQYLEERELTAWLLVDLSASMRFGTRRQLKRDTAIEFAGVAAYIITRHGDKAGVMGFPGRDSFIPPRSGRMHALRVIHVLEQTASRDAESSMADARAAKDASAAADLGQSLRHIVRLLRRRSLVFVISDFLGPEGWESSIRELSRRHDVIAVWIQDPAERELPDVGGLFVRDPETGQQLWVDTSDPALRKAYRELTGQQRSRVQNALRTSRVDVLELSTAEPLVDPLVRFIQYRRRKGRWNLAGR